MSTVRPAGDGDLDGIARVAAANDAPMHDAGRDPAYVHHLLADGQVVVAESDAGEVVGFGAALPMGRTTMLTDLFVDPGIHGGGTGRALVAALLQDRSGPVVTFSSADPRALPVYARAGLVPWWSLLYLSGAPGAAPEPDRFWHVHETDAESAAVVEAQLTGRDRAASHRYWESRPGSAALVVSHRREAAAVAVTRPSSAGGMVLDRLVAGPGMPGPDPLFSVLRLLADHGSVRLFVPGPHPALRPLLECGFRMTAADTFMSTDDRALDPTRVCPHPGLA